MVRSLTADQARELVESDDLDIIDVRDPAEWAAGHLPGARLIPLCDLRDDPKAILTRDGVLFVCAAGVRSQTAARLAEATGLTRLYNLTGGTRGWANAGHPLVTE